MTPRTRSGDPVAASAAVEVRAEVAIARTRIHFGLMFYPFRVAIDWLTPSELIYSQEQKNNAARIDDRILLLRWSNAVSRRSRLAPFVLLFDERESENALGNCTEVARVCCFGGSRFILVQSERQAARSVPRTSCLEALLKVFLRSKSL